MPDLCPPQYICCIVSKRPSIAHHHTKQTPYQQPIQQALQHIHLPTWQSSDSSTLAPAPKLAGQDVGARNQSCPPAIPRIAADTSSSRCHQNLPNIAGQRASSCCSHLVLGAAAALPQESWPSSQNDEVVAISDTLGGRRLHRRLLQQPR